MQKNKLARAFVVGDLLRSAAFAPGRRTSRLAPVRDTLLEFSGRYIARRINLILGWGETGIPFWGMNSARAK